MIYTTFVGVDGKDEEEADPLLVAARGVVGEAWTDSGLAYKTQQ